ncbi:DUF4344 domain-containing metallopeptidase [Streptomyces xanthophaeus]|uniref:DUF4344 domain-containing metallopeptidase n=1 Tax=Streptomyces xanthophaeus TaxID=67385 RepID=UPI00399005BD
MVGRRAGAGIVMVLSLAFVAGCSAEGPGAGRAEPGAQVTGRPARASSPPPPAVKGEGKLVATYERGTTIGDTHAQGFLEDHKVLQEVADYANSLIKLAYDVPLKAATCEDGSASWNADSKDITYCYDFVNQMRGIYEGQETQGPAEQRDRAVDEDLIGLTNGVLFHELAHGLIDMYDLPITGREEDAADQLSVLLLAGGDEKHKAYAMSTVNAWAGLWDFDGVEGDEPGSYADGHSLNAQRFFNWSCWLYGSDPRTYSYVVQSETNPDGVLPQDRAERCPAEFDKLDQAWGTLLHPYLRNPDRS